MATYPFHDSLNRIKIGKSHFLARDFANCYWKHDFERSLFVAAYLESVAKYLDGNLDFLKSYRFLSPASICMFKVNNNNIRTRCKRCTKLTIKTPERRQWRHSSVFIVSFEHISHFVLVFLLLTLNK